MEGLNLRGDPAPAEEPPPEEPLGLDLIRGWLKKPRPRLRLFLLWGPYLAKGVRKGYRWLRKNSGPALRRTAETLRKTAKVTQALRKAAERLSARLERTFPPGSRGRAVAAHLAGGSRLLGQSALLLVGIGREAEHLSVYGRGHGRGERPHESERPLPADGPDPETETPPRPEPDEPGASRGAGPAVRDEPADPPGPPAGGHPPASSSPEGSPASEVPRPEPPQPESPQQEPSELEPSREDAPASDSAEPAPADSSPVPGLPPGPRADALAKLSKRLRGQILSLSKRPRKAALRFTIWRILNECGEMTSEELGLLLQMDPANLAKRHLSPLVEEGVVERTIPDRINHPEQAYRSTRFPPGAHRPPAAQG